MIDIAGKPYNGPCCGNCMFYEGGACCYLEKMAIPMPFWAPSIDVTLMPQDKLRGRECEAFIEREGPPPMTTRRSRR